MIFNSFSFALFFILIFISVPFLPLKARTLALIGGSYVFYASANPIWLLILLGCTLADFHLAHWIDRSSRRIDRVIALTISCVINVGLLLFFKYSGFMIENLRLILAEFEINLVPFHQPELPFGISFFIFESLAYIIDVYRGQMRATRSLAEYALFISFFPHLVAGPIVRARDFIPQIQRHRPLVPADTVAGIELILLGLFKKVIIADGLAPKVNEMFGQGAALSGGGAWSAAILFAIQIYCDFSGYTDIARGIARMLGFTLCENFRWPYFSRSIRDFWRRWHMSLSSWLRDYLYISLGGNRHGAARMAMAITVTWFLGGLWHGAAFHFIAWGLYHGGLVTLGALLYPRYRWLWDRLGVFPQITVTFALVCIGWVFFRADNTVTALKMIANMLQPWQPGFLSNIGLSSLIWVPPLALAHLFSQRLYGQANTPSRLGCLPWNLRVLVIATALMALVLCSGESGPFIYFQF